MKINVTKKCLTLMMAGAISLTAFSIPANAAEKVIFNEKSIDDSVIYEAVFSDKAIPVYEKPLFNSNVVRYLPKGKTVKSFNMRDRNFYQVQFEDNSYGYVARASVYKTVIRDFPYSFEKYGYINDDISMYVVDSNSKGKFVDVPKYEFCEIYEEYEDDYLVKTNDYIGYCNKNNIELVNEPVVVVDISDQQLKMYDNNKIILESDVVTGKSTTPTRIGYFSVNSIRKNTVLKGPGYSSDVSYFAPFDRGIGFHDADYHVNTNGRKIGWRDLNEFGGTTYIKNGSHGCVNMPYQKVMELSENLRVDTKVIIKK